MSKFDRDYAINLCLGKISNTSVFAKWGRNEAISSGTPEDIWDGGGNYTGFATILESGNAEKMEIFSSAAADAAAGTGARTVEISNLLDDDGNLMPPQTVTLNGTTPVEIDATQTYARASRMKVLTAGSGGANAGTLTLRHVTTTANIFAKMPIGYNQTQIACYTVPVGYKLLINKIYAGANLSGGSAQNVEGALVMRPFGEVFQNKLPISISSSKDFLAVGEKYFYCVDEKTDVKVRALVLSGTNTVMTASFGGELVKV